MQSPMSHEVAPQPPLAAAIDRQQSLNVVPLATMHVDHLAH